MKSAAVPTMHTSAGNWNERPSKARAGEKMRSSDGVGLGHARPLVVHRRRRA
jgi:hypothetical protein